MGGAAGLAVTSPVCCECCVSPIGADRGARATLWFSKRFPWAALAAGSYSLAGVNSKEVAK